MLKRNEFQNNPVKNSYDIEAVEIIFYSNEQASLAREDIDGFQIDDGDQQVSIR